ncbi:ribosome hibernation-promoting factor, HPF/YfiA family [Dermacoccaceae bacterium W4C1]
MEITVTGRHATVPERFRRHIEEKLAKVAQLDSRVTRCEVVVTHEANPRQAKEAERIELTCHAKRTVIRAEAGADDPYAALDIAMTRLLERVRRLNDKRRVHRGRQTPLSVAKATAGLDVATFEEEEATIRPDVAKVGGDEDCPVRLREKVHSSVPMSVDEALKRMELVGHDFFLFHDTETDQPSVVYRRRGWSYGVLHLDVATEASASATA